MLIVYTKIKVFAMHICVFFSAAIMVLVNV